MSASNRISQVPAHLDLYEDISAALMRLEDGRITVQEYAGDCNVIQCFKQRLAGVHTPGLCEGR